jgi:hypothetical protein
MAKNIAWSICQGRWRSVSVWRLAFGVWRLAFGVRRSAFGGRAKISARRQQGYLQARVRAGFEPRVGQVFIDGCFKPRMRVAVRLGEVLLIP